MFQTLLNLFLTPDARADLQPQDCRMAMSALMVRIARADDQYDASEHKVILSVLQNRYNLTLEQAQEVKAEAESLESHAPDTVRFTKIIKDNVPYEERTSVVESLWRVALADGIRDHEEDGFLRLVVNLLGVNDRDSGHARQHVIAELEAGK